MSNIFESRWKEKTHLKREQEILNWVDKQLARKILNRSLETGAKLNTSTVMILVIFTVLDDNAIIFRDLHPS